MKAMGNDKKIYFVVPDPSSFQSGGNIYNQNLIRGMIESGANVEQLDWNQFKDLSCKNPDAFFFIDTLYMEKWLRYRHNIMLQCEN